MVSGAPYEKLERGIAALGLALDDARAERLYRFAELLARWNRVYNLTGAATLDEIVVRHLLDSLAVLPHLPGGGRLIDVGSGAGLPGVPLAIARPGLAVTLLDASAKRVRFLNQALLELRLDNAEAARERVTAFRPAPRYDAVITRAFASLSDMLTAVRHLVADDGVVLAMKGARVAEELQVLPPGYRLVDALPLAVPGLDAARHLLRFVPTAAPSPGQREP